MKAFVATKTTPLAEPDEIVSEDGTVKVGGIRTQPDSSARPDPVSVTVQALEESGPTVVGLHAMEVMEVIPVLPGSRQRERRRFGRTIQSAGDRGRLIRGEGASRCKKYARRRAGRDGEGGWYRQIGRTRIQADVSTAGSAERHCASTGRKRAHRRRVTAMEEIEVFANGATSESVVDWEEPFSVPVTVTN